MTIALVIATLILTSAANASTYRLGKWSPGIGNVYNAVFWAFCGHRYRYCTAGWEAWRVSACESGHSVWAVNGQYLGLFQAGSFMRARYGHGRDPWTQSVAAFRYWRDAGSDWSPWSCKP